MKVTSPQQTAIIIARLIIVILVLGWIVREHNSIIDAVIKQLHNPQPLAQSIIIISLVICVIIGHLGIRHIINRLDGTLITKTTSADNASQDVLDDLTQDGLSR